MDFQADISNRRAGPPAVTTICHPVWRLARGGLECQLVQTLNHMRFPRFRHIVVIAGWDDQSEILASQLARDILVIRQPVGIRGGAWSRALAGVLREHQVDLIHVRGLSLLTDSIMAADLYGGAKVACSFHGFQQDQGEIQGVRRKTVREALLRCQARWAVGQSAARAISTALNLPVGAFRVISNGVDTARFRTAGPAERAAARAQLQLPADQTVLLCVANLKPIKGQAVLLEALQHIGVRARAFTTVLVGEDGCRRQLHDWAARCLPQVDVRFAGETDDPLPWYHAADVYVQPSRSEGLCNALLEAMASGLPTVATNTGGNADVIQHGVTGRLAEAGDAISLAHELEIMLADGHARSQLAVAGQLHVCRNFSLKQMIAGYAEQYDSLGGNHQTTPFTLTPRMTGRGRVPTLS